MRQFASVVAVLLLTLLRSEANVPGGGTGTGANVTLVDNGTTVTLSNGIISIPITKSDATIHQINYTYNNGSGTTTTQMLNGGYNGGQFYWELGGFGSGTFTYSIVANPLSPTGTNAVGDYAEIDLVSSATASGSVDIHFSMRRGSPGFYVTAIWSHGSANPAIGLGETRTNIYSGSIFNWMSVDAARNRQMQVSSGSTSAAVYNAPKEVSLWTNGVYQGQYEDKYKYSADFGTQRVWGWSSVTTANPSFTGKNVGLWDVIASPEYYPGGPMKRELMCHIGTTILNMFQGSHYGGGTDSDFSAGEVWAKTYGPYFVYCNNVATNNADPAGTLYADAQAQATAEATAWPYSWFSNSNYAAASARGTITGKMVINDTANPNASAGGLWVGVSQQPATSNAVYDFQKWMKNYQFWVKTDASGNFTIPNVIAGANYTLYAFGPGAAGTFQSQALTGGSLPITTNIPSTPFSVSVTGGGTTSLGKVTWTPTRVGPTVFEIGYPNRTTDKFRHGDDYWVSDVGPSPTSPSPIWSKYLDYPVDFPTGPNYTVGTSRWATGWNYIQPVVTDSAGNFNASTSTINFNLAATPSTGAQAASIYIALASDYQGPIIVTVNGTNLGSVTTTATPNAESSTGYFPSWSSSADQSDTPIREGAHGCYSDERVTFAGSLLKKGANVITVQMRKGGYFANHAMYDYLRLELVGYSPPAPASVTAYAGNGRALLSWPVTPGATSYNILRSTTTGTGYVSLAAGVIGPVSGSGPSNATYADITTANGTTYYYVVQSVNPTGVSANSTQSAGVTPTAATASAAPATPTGLTATTGNGNVTLNWTATTGATYYTVQRGTVVNARGYVPSYTTLSNTLTSPTFTDTTPSNGATYSYFVTASNAAGDSPASAALTAKPLATATPASPATFTATALQGASAGSMTLSWSAVSGAVGYVLQSATTAAGPYTYVQSITETTYTDTGLSPNTTYYYEVAANSTGGASSYVLANAITPPDVPANLVAVAGNTQVQLTWSATTGATSYIVQRGTISGTYTTTIPTSGPSFADTGLTNGATYYYAVAAVGAGGTGLGSVEASAVPVASVPVAPTNLAATPGNTQVVLNWASSTGATSYAVRRASNRGGPYTTISSAVTGTSYINTGLTNGAAYYYVVAATNTGGTGANSSEVSAVPLSAPAAPANLVATPGNAQIVLSWSASIGASSYTLKRGSASGQETTTISSAIATPTYTDTGLTNGVTYYYVVSASNSAGTSINSAEASAKPAQTFDQWAAAAFPGQTDPSVVGSNANPDGDAFVNLIEYFSGTNPTIADSGNVVTYSINAQGNLVFNFRMAKNLTGVSYTIQQSSDVSHWSDTGVQGSVVSDQGAYYQMQAIVPIGTSANLFLRLAVIPGD